ncbi:dAMP1 SANT/Myb-like domain-containing protein [Entamoeba marina]
MSKPTLPSLSSHTFQSTLDLTKTPEPQQSQTQLQPQQIVQKHFLDVGVVEMYSDEEYEKHLIHKEWTRATTDSMMEYVKQYGMCWEVIHDRLVVYNEFRLTVDAVIERYLQIAIKLAQIRFVAKYPTQSFIHPYDFFPFDRRYEEKRKADGMQSLIENVVNLPQAKLFVPQSLLLMKEDDIVDDDSGLGSVWGTLSPGVYSRFQLLEKTDLFKLSLSSEKEISLISTLMIVPDEEISKMCEGIKETLHQIEELRKRCDNLKRKFE